MGSLFKEIDTFIQQALNWLKKTWYTSLHQKKNTLSKSNNSSLRVTQWSLILKVMGL